MKVALTAEGTYPHQLGGVSVWTDQLIRGMPDHEFLVVALVATGKEPVRWALPENVSAMDTIALWGPPVPVPVRARLARAPLARSRASLPVHELIDILLRPPAEAQDQFGELLHEFFSYGQTANLSAALAGEGAVRVLNEAWQERWQSPGWAMPGTAEPSPDSVRVPATLHDAVTAMQLIEHALRPLSHPPPQADVVHAVTDGIGVLPALAARWRYGTPVIVTEHGVYMREQYMHNRQPAFRWPVKKLFLNLLSRICTLGYQEASVITPGNVYNKRWEAHLGADISRVQTIYNGVSPADFPALDSEPEVPTITWVGRVDPVKDIETLLQAFYLVRAEMPEARLRIFGSPPPGGEAYLQHCRELASELSLTEAATFEGRVTEIRDAYKAGHIVVLCSISEGFPYALIEAMTCGRPCVATGVGGVSEAIGETGLVVPPRNPQVLARACLRLLRDGELRRELGIAARLRALEFFTVDRAINAFEEIYTFLGSGRPILTADLDGADAPDGTEVPMQEKPEARARSRWTVRRALKHVAPGACQTMGGATPLPTRKTR